MIQDRIVNAIPQLNRLATLEYSIGFVAERIPASNEPPRITVAQMPYHVFPSQQGNLPWRNRSRIFVPTEDIALLTRSARLLHYTIDAALWQTSRTKPLSVIISTTLRRALCGPQFLARHGMPQFPANNKLENLQLRCLGQNISRSQHCVGQLRVHFVAPTAVQFTSLRRLSLAGEGLHHGLSLNLVGLGSSLYSPVLPNLEVLILENVQVGKDTVDYLRQRPIRLMLHNVFWFDECIESFRSGSILQSVIIAGIHVVDFEDDPQIHPVQGCVDQTGALEGADYASIEYFDLVWRVASSILEVKQLAMEHSEYCIKIYGRPTHLSIATPDVLSQYILRGGICPLNWQNISGASWALEIPADDNESEDEDDQI
jgi:hypothetical protein